MADNETRDGRREPSDTQPRRSMLPRRTRGRQMDPEPKADCNSGSRKSSSVSAGGAQTSNPSSPEPMRSGDTARSTHRNPSATSLESYDTSGPETPRSARRSLFRRGKSEDGRFGYFNPEHAFRRSKSVTIAPSADIIPAEQDSQIPRSPGAKGSPLQPLVKRTYSFKIMDDPTVAEQVDNRRVPSNIGLKQRDSRPLDSQTESETMYSRESSYVQVDNNIAQRPDNKDSTGDQPISEAKDSMVEEKGELDSGLSQTDETYASVLKRRLDDDYTPKNHDDDDDSYPDLDDMSVEEVHRPPPRNPNGGIRWAPWNVPFARRGQTLVVLLHSLSIVANVSLFFAFCANPFAWPLLLLYLLHVLSSKAATDGSLKYRSEWIRKSYVWRFFADYYPARLHKTHDLPPTRKYIFGYHPHGIISHGAWAAFATDALGFSQKFPGITNSLLTLDSNFRIPFYREYLLAMGVRSVSRESIVNILSKGGANGEGMGRGVTVVVGGARESLEAQPGRMRLVLRERKGFIKLAVRCGADLVPVLAFGENDLYDQLQPHEHPYMHRIQMFVLKVWKFTLPFLHGRGIFNYDVGLMPYRRPLNVVVGAPIKVRQSAVVDMEEVNRLHGLYVAEVEKLWDRYKDEFAPDRKEEMQLLP